MSNEILTKKTLTLRVQYLDAIIKDVAYDNCYNSILDFFKVTSYLHDRRSQIDSLPLKGWKFLGHVSRSRKKAEEKKNLFIQTLNRAGRDSKYNHSHFGEEVTKEDIFFGNACGVVNGRISKFESSSKSQIQEVVRPQIIKFVESFKDQFSLDWLR